AELVAAEEREGDGERFCDLGCPTNPPQYHAAIHVIRVEVDAQVQKRLEALGEEAGEEQSRLDARGAGALAVFLVPPRQGGGQGEGEPRGDVDGRAVVDQVLGAEEHIADTSGVGGARGAEGDGPPVLERELREAWVGRQPVRREVE